MTGEARMDRDPEFQEILSLLPGTVLGRGMEQFTKSEYRRGNPGRYYKALPGYAAFWKE